MKRMRRFGAVLAATLGALSFAQLPAVAADAAPTPDREMRGALPAGGRYVLTSPFSVPLTAIEFWYTAPSTGYGQAPVVSLSRLSAQAIAASTPVTGTSLGDYLSSIGGSLSIDAFATSIGITAIVPTAYAEPTMRLMSESYFAPVVTDAGLRRAKLDLTAQGLFEKYNPVMVIRDGLMSSLFTSGPQHYPTLDTHTLGAIDLPAVTAFAERAFTARRVSLVVAGAPGGTSIIDAAVPGRTTAEKPTAQADLPDSPLAEKPAETTLKFTEPGAGFAWAGPEIHDDQAATAMDFLADYLFNPVSGKITKRLNDELPGVTLNGQFITLRKPGIFVVSVSGQGSDKAAKIVRDEIAALDTPLDQKSFDRARTLFAYHLQSELQNPSDLAASLGWYATEGEAAYAPGAQGGDSYFLDVAMLTPDSVSAVAQRYLHTQPAVVKLDAAAGGKTR